MLVNSLNFKSDNYINKTPQNLPQKDYVSSSLNSFKLEQMANINKMALDMVKMPEKFSRHNLDNYYGCLIGGAVGDAFGAVIEPVSLEVIKSRYGAEGLRYLPLRNGVARITDDTQMSLFTAYAVIKSKIKNNGEYIEEDLLSELANAYKNWYLTQTSEFIEPVENNFLLNDERLYSRRFPGNTCMEALEKDVLGTIDEPINDSKGSGGVMRAAPIGLGLYDDPDFAFSIAQKSAAMTHGNPKGYLPAGALAYMIAYILKGDDLCNALDKTIVKLQDYSIEGIELAELLKKAAEYAAYGLDDNEAIENLGQGWHGDEALAISVFCALKHKDDFKEAVIASVNHSGDSDTTGAITGNILGAYLGADKIKSSLKNKIELYDLITQISSDLYSSPGDIKNAKSKYGVEMKEISSKERQKEDEFSFRTAGIKFSSYDIDKLKELPIKEAMEYRRNLILNGLYNLAEDSSD
ncbi:MAG: ADP-ribosylglycohydrolase family protein [Candidatus Gastranaerophilales bacterium]|nr:ADP-ribosylglycohydrolase family protein [Candidatus Gastranaerophilales bacterium]